MNEDRVIELLNAGYSISEVAEELEVKSKNLYHIAKKHKLPYNSPIKVGGPKEKRIIRLFNSGFSYEDIGKIFSQSPMNIKKIIKRQQEK
tara:strand:+ start:2160 stop:2429 length:270 start_codon:yes stop_codon:yes gene_type:complete